MGNTVENAGEKGRLVRTVLPLSQVLKNPSSRHDNDALLFLGVLSFKREKLRVRSPLSDCSISNKKMRRNRVGATKRGANRRLPPSRSRRLSKLPQRRSGEGFRHTCTGEAIHYHSRSCNAGLSIVSVCSESIMVVDKST